MTETKRPDWQCQADGVRNGPDGPGGTEHYWTCTAPGTVDVDGTLMCEDHAGQLGHGPKQEEYGYDPADGPVKMEVTADAKTPDCPVCGEPPMMVMGGGTQAFCGTREGCPVMTWNPMESREHFFRTAQQIEITQEGGG